MAYEGYGSDEDEFGRRDRFRRERRSPPRGMRDGGDYYRGDPYPRKRDFASPDGRDMRKRPRRSASPPYYDGYRDSFGRDRVYDERRRDDNRLVDPRMLDYIVPLKYFAEYMRQANPRLAANDDELRAAYGDYKDGALARQLLSFFDTHKTEDWFLEKYHPDRLAQRTEISIQRKREQFSAFIEQLESGKFDRISLDVDSERDLPGSDETVENGDAGDVPLEQNDSAVCIYFKTIPPTISRLTIQEALSTLGNLRELYLFEPNPQKKFHRTGLAVFEGGVDAKEIIQKLSETKIDNFTFPTTDQKQLSGRPKISHSAFSDISRLRQDLDNVQKLAAMFEAELGDDFKGSEKVIERVTIIKSLLEEEDKLSEQDEIKKILDLFITYLRQVFNCCYYDAILADSQEELKQRCPQHKRYGNEYPNGTPNSGFKVLKSFDAKVDLLINRSTVDLAKIGGRPIASVRTDVVKQQIKIEDGSKYRCNLCGKLFRGEEFVEKHIQNKHSEIIEAAIKEAEFYNNYVLDPAHISPSSPPQPQMQMSHTAMMPMMTPPRGMMAMPGFPPLQAAPLGVPMDQIPRIGFGPPSNVLPPAPPPPPSTGRWEDPRQMRSYEDLDAPAEGDVELKY